MSELLRVSLPALIRKLGRKRYWGSPDQPEPEWVAEVLKNVFLNDQPPYSLYRVSSDTDLHRVALALNAGRKEGSLSEDSSFVAFLPDELDAVGIKIQQIAGDTPCRYANQLYYDAFASEAQLRQFVTQVIRAGRPVTPLTKGAMKQVVDKATSEHCLATIRDTAECRVEGCPRPTA